MGRKANVRQNDPEVPKQTGVSDIWRLGAKDYRAGDDVGLRRPSQREIGDRPHRPDKLGGS